MNWFHAVLLLFVWSPCYCEIKKNFDININSDGSYKLLTNGNEWLTSANTFMWSKNVQYDTNSKSLILQNVSSSEGSDVLGKWKASTFVYTLHNESAIKMNCVIIKYNDLNLVRFVQVLKITFF